MVEDEEGNRAGGVVVCKGCADADWADVGREAGGIGRADADREVGFDVGAAVEGARGWADAEELERVTGWASVEGKREAVEGERNGMREASVVVAALVLSSSVELDGEYMAVGKDTRGWSRGTQEG